MKLRFILPLGLFVLVFILLFRGLGLHPSEVPSPLIGKPAPQFQLPVLGNPSKITTHKDFIGHITLVNVWASWCSACASEHDLLVQLSAEEPDLVFYGLNYKDDPKAAAAWLHERGNPYDIVALDPEGTAAIDWGVYGTPETFIIDKKGFIRYKQIGSITDEIWNQEIKPVINTLRGEAS